MDRISDHEPNYDSDDNVPIHRHNEQHHSHMTKRVDQGIHTFEYFLTDI